MVKPYCSKKTELSVEDRCVLWDTRVVVTPQLRSQVLDKLHEEHPGIGWIKSFTRSYVWWPGLNAYLENKAQKCMVCQQVQKMLQNSHGRGLICQGKDYTKTMWVLYWVRVFKNGGYSLKMDRCSCGVICIVSCDYWQTAINFHKARSYLIMLSHQQHFRKSCKLSICTRSNVIPLLSGWLSELYRLQREEWGSWVVC